MDGLDRPFQLGDSYTIVGFSRMFSAMLIDANMNCLINI